MAAPELQYSLRLNSEQQPLKQQHNSAHFNRVSAVLPRELVAGQLPLLFGRWAKLKANTEALQLLAQLQLLPQELTR